MQDAEGQNMEKAIVFGCGRYYQSKKEQVHKRYEIIGFLDNTVKPGKIQSYEGKSMVNPEDMDSFGTNCQG